MDFNYIQHQNIDSALLEAVCNIKEESWPYGVEKQKEWLSKNLHRQDVHVLGFANSKLVSYCNMVGRYLIINNQLKVSILGIGNVCVSKAQARKGLGTELMLAVNKYLEGVMIPGALLCKDHLLNFYIKSGWQKLSVLQLETRFSLLSINCLSFNLVYKPNDKIFIEGSAF